MSQAGSLQNMLAGRSTQSFADAPSIGQSVTIVGFTDRDAATIIRIISPTKMEVQLDKVQFAYPSGSPISIEPDPKGRVETVRRVTRGKSKGQWRCGPCVVMIGVRDPYYDHQF